MTEKQLTLLSKAQSFVSDLYSNKVSKSLSFHDLEHTQNVVIAAEEMAQYYQLEDEDHASLAVAAWFHDIGYVKGDPNGHEEVGMDMATQFLKENETEEAFIQRVRAAIESTRMPQSPGNLIEQILCDADLYHLGTEDFWDKSNDLRDELNGLTNKKISRKQWRKINISFLETHVYFTDFARRKLQPGKEKNLERLKNGEGKEKKKSKKDSLKDAMEATIGEPNQQDKPAKNKQDKTDRQASTVFRIMALNHTNLSQMADSKANILISVNSIILTILISVLLARLEENMSLVYPTIILLTVCVSAIVFSILATRPNVSEGKFTREDIQNKKTNLLFFGNFHKMSLGDYDWAMNEMLKDKQYLYSSMIKDNYFLGVVLARKYRYLRISYSIFMYGIIVAVLAFAVAMLFPQAAITYVAG